MVAVTPFERALAFVLEREGGFVDDAADPGGETNCGITWSSLRAASFLGIVPAGTTIRAMTPQVAGLIYRALYWDLIKGDQLPAALAFQVFDAATNQGVSGAVKALQAALGVTVDGMVGPATIAASSAKLGVSALNEFASQRIMRYAGTENFDRFGLGWIRRAVASHAESVRDLMEGM